MRIIQTFYTKNIRQNNSYGNWLTEESSYVCWALSCLMARKLYGAIELYTDYFGADILVNKFRLPYDKVHIVFDNASILNEMPSYLWAASKIYTYSLQTEPFVHIDGDFVFWKKFELNKPLLFQNIEYEVPLYQRLYHALKKNRGHSAFEQCLNDDFIGGAFNMGLFGGTQLQTIRDYSQHSLEYALLNRTNPIFEANRTDINCFIEQYYAYYMVRRSSISEAAIHNPVRYESKKKEEIADFNLCEKSVGFSHYLGKSKQNYYVIDFIHKELSKNFRNDYERIHQYLKNGRCKKNYFARVNDKININDLYEDLITRLNKCHYYIDDELKEDYKQYLRDRLFLLNKKLSNNSLPISTPSEVLTMRDLTYRTKVRLNDNFLLIKKYLCPWSEMYKAENFVYKEKIITKDDINIKYPKYCIYAWLPSEQSLPSVWVDNITAYFIYKVLSKEYQAIEIIQEKLNRLLKDDNQTLPLKYIINLLGTVNKYKILDFSNE